MTTEEKIAAMCEDLAARQQEAAAQTAASDQQGDQLLFAAESLRWLALVIRQGDVEAGAIGRALERRVRVGTVQSLDEWLDEL